jgi:hypothetical protein
MKRRMIGARASLKESPKGIELKEECENIKSTTGRKIEQRKINDDVMTIKEKETTDRDEHLIARGVPEKMIRMTRENKGNQGMTLIDANLTQQSRGSGQLSRWSGA